MQKLGAAQQHQSWKGLILPSGPSWESPSECPFRASLGCNACQFAWGNQEVMSPGTSSPACSLPWSPRGKSCSRWQADSACPPCPASHMTWPSFVCGAPLDPGTHTSAMNKGPGKALCGKEQRNSSPTSARPAPRQLSDFFHPFIRHLLLICFVPGTSRYLEYIDKQSRQVSLPLRSLYLSRRQTSKPDCLLESDE